MREETELPFFEAMAEQRWLVYGDLQATDGHERLRADPTVPLQRWRAAEFFKVAQDVADAHSVDALIDLGDTTDDRNYIFRSTLSTVLSGLSPWSPCRDRSLKLTGNHEQDRRDGGTDAREVYDPYFRTGSVIDTKVFGVNILGLSFSEDVGGLVATTEAWLKKTAGKKLLLGHFEVDGCNLGGGKQGTGFPKSLLKHFDLCLFGHIHKHQKVADNAWYVGSPFQQNHGEARDRKYVAILTAPSLTLEWVDITDKFPSYRTLLWKDFESLKTLGEDRVKVHLATVEEYALYTAHPLSALTTPEMAQVTEALAAKGGEEVVSKSAQEYVEEYASMRPLPGYEDAEGIEFMKQLGLDILCPS